jgi:hypothetical protein
MKIRNALIGLAVLVPLSAPARCIAAELSQETLKAWNSYVRRSESNMKERLEPGHSFLWADEQPGRSSLLQNGNILVAPLVAHGWQVIPGGLIHDWIGAAFIPNAGIQDVLAVVHDYPRYKEIYKPAVVDSRVLDCSGAEQKFSMLLQRKVLFVTAAVASQYESRDFQIDSTSWYSIANTTRVQEVQNYGRDGERLLPPDEGDGFIWRMSGIARYEERDGGVYVEIEALALTRDIPGSLRWLVAPVVSRLSRDSIITMLRQTRAAVHGNEHLTERAASCGVGGRRGPSLLSGFRATGSASQTWLSGGK